MSDVAAVLLAYAAVIVGVGAYAATLIARRKRLEQRDASRRDPPRA